MIVEHQLKVQRLKYSNLSKTDLNDLYACLSEPRVTDPIYWLNKPFLKEDAEALLARAMSEQKAQTDYWLAARNISCLLYTSPSPRDQRGSRMPSSA